MPRQFAKLLVTTAADTDYADLSMDEQWVYQHLCRLPEMSLAGVVTIPRHFWKGSTRDPDTAERIAAGARGLAERDYIVIDDVTDEILVRTFMRHDGLTAGPPGPFKAALVAARYAKSPRIRAALYHELMKLDEVEIEKRRVPAKHEPVIVVYRATLAALRPSVPPSGGTGSPGLTDAIGDAIGDSIERAHGVGQMPHDMPPSDAIGDSTGDSISGAMPGATGAGTGAGAGAYVPVPKNFLLEHTPPAPAHTPARLHTPAHTHVCPPAREAPPEPAEVVVEMPGGGGRDDRPPAVDRAARGPRRQGGAAGVARRYGRAKTARSFQVVTAAAAENGIGDQLPNSVFSDLCTAVEHIEAENRGAHYSDDQLVAAVTALLDKGLHPKLLPSVLTEVLARRARPAPSPAAVRRRSGRRNADDKIRDMFAGEPELAGYFEDPDAPPSLRALPGGAS